jgi:hypothetical protein
LGPKNFPIKFIGRLYGLAKKKNPGAVTKPLVLFPRAFIWGIDLKFVYSQVRAFNQVGEVQSQKEAA